MSMKPLLLALAALGLSLPAAAQAPNEPYEVSVWARVLFGTDGKPVEYALVDEEKYPAKFAENVKARIARASIPPPAVDGKPATLRSGVEMRFTVTPSSQGGTVKVDGIAMGAMPLRKYFAAYPQDIAQIGGWKGEATGVCRIGTEGRCTSVEVTALPGMPESVRRHVKASLEKWQFEPQQIGGQPVEGEYRLKLRYDTPDSMPEDFREDKFLRILKSR